MADTERSPEEKSLVMTSLNHAADWNGRKYELTEKGAYLFADLVRAGVRAAPTANTLDELSGALKRSQVDNVEALLKAWMAHTGCGVDDAVLVQQVTFENGVAANRYWFERKEKLPAPPPTANPLYTCVGKGGSYELLGRAIFAGELKNFDPVTAYRDTKTGQLFLRAPADFEARMQPMKGTDHE